MVAHLTCNEVVVSSTLTGSSTNIVRKCYFIYLLYYVPLAQSVEPLTVNQMVVGSSPTRHAINLHKYKYFVFREMASLMKFISCVLWALMGLYVSQDF